MKKDKKDAKQSNLSLKKEALRRLTLTDDELKIVAGGRPPDSRPTTPDEGC